MTENKGIVQIIVSDGLEESRNVDGTTYNKLVQPALSIRLPFVPSAVSFHVMVMTTGLNLLEETNFNLKIVGVDDDEVMFVAEHKLPAFDRNFDNFNFNIDVKNMPVMSKGMYKIDLEINNTPYEQKFYIYADKVFDHAKQ